MSSDQTHLIVGASLGGAKAAEALRQEGFDGRVVLIGAEEERPYERPPSHESTRRSTRCSLPAPACADAWPLPMPTEPTPATGGASRTSTGTKDPGYSDVLYVEELVAPEVVSTMPEATLRAFVDHGRTGPGLSVDAGAAESTLRRAAEAGIDLDTVTAELEREGVEAFCHSYDTLLSCMAAKAERLADGGRVDGVWA